MKLIPIIYFSLLFGDLIHPPDNSEINYVHIKFRWKMENNATSYIFELSNSSDFSSLLINENISDTSHVINNNINWQSTYHWRVKPLDGEYITSFSFTTKKASYEFTDDVSPIEIVENNLGSSSNGIVIYGIMSPFYSAAIDMQGNEIWNSGGVDNYMFSYVENNSFLGDANLPPHFKGELGVEFSIEDGIIWSQPTYGDESDFLQHDLIKLPNGNYLGFVITDSLHHVPNSNDYDLPFNFSFEDNIPGFSDDFVYPWIWKGERIVEWDINGDEVWSWDPFDHYSLDDFDYISYFWENVASSGDPFDWTHFNALAYDEIENAIYVSSKNLSRITKIDKETGDVIWNMGIPWLSGENILEPDNYFSGQHGLELLDNRNIVFFDNGILSGRFDGTNIYKSSAIELKINNINGEFNVETIWSHTLPVELYGVISGNVQKLINGNYLITTVGSSDGAHTLEITPSHEIAWDCKFNVGTPQGAIYRAMKINGLYKTNLENECTESLGDMDVDGEWDVIDIATLVNCILAANCNEIENGCTGDMNSNGVWNIIDIIALVNCVINENCS